MDQTKNFDISSLTNQQLEQFRLKTDPLADQTIRSIIESGHEKQINEVFMTLVRSDSFDHETFSSFEPKLADILNEYITESATLPSWLDSQKIKQGEKLFSLYGPEIFMILNVSSLPMCYTCAKGAQVLYDTGRLMSHGGNTDPLARRLMETAQMIVNVMAPRGISPSGKGVITTQKIRLIHASIRYFLKESQYNNTPWDVEKFGEPINQEDLAGTLMSFGPVILSGLDQLNIKLSQTEQDAYMHCWKVIGHLMGIDAALLPDSYEDGFGLATKILKHQAAESEAGKELTKSCIRFMQNIVPGNAFDNVPEYFIHYFFQNLSKSTGLDLAKMIGIGSKESLKDKIVLTLTKSILGLLGHLEHHKTVQLISKPFNRAFMKGIIYHFNDGKQVQFNIPPSLQKDWKINEEWTNQWSSPEILGHRISIQKQSETTKIK